MIRVNTIRAIYLMDQQLLNEYIAISEVPDFLAEALKSKKWADIKLPPAYNLGDLHVQFFFNKKEFLHQRFAEIGQELARRDVFTDRIQEPLWRQFDIADARGMPQIQWTPTVHSKASSLKNIFEEMAANTNAYTYCGEPLNMQKFISYTEDMIARHNVSHLLSTTYNETHFGRHGWCFPAYSPIHHGSPFVDDNEILK